MTDRVYSAKYISGSMLAQTARWIDALRGQRGCFFTFHRAAPSAIWHSLPNRGFYLDLDFLDSLLTYLKASGRHIVTIEEGLRMAANEQNHDSFVNFSIDDCYRDTYEQVVPLFRRHGVPITLFVTTGIPDATMPIWWAGLEDAIFTRDFPGDFYGPCRRGCRPGRQFSRRHHYHHAAPGIHAE